MAETMIERVARALSATQGMYWTEHLRAARAAIEAMREPTDRMLDAGVAANTVELPSGGQIIVAVDPAWDAMIDAALAEGTEAAPRPASPLG